MRQGPKLKLFDKKVMNKIIKLIDEDNLSLKKIAKKMHTHYTVLHRNLKKHYGEEGWEIILEEFRAKRGLQPGNEIGKGTRFQRGQLTGRNAKRIHPIGSTMIKCHRNLTGRKRIPKRYIKIDDKPYGNYKVNWVLYNRWLWERHNGPIPEGMCIVPLDGNHLNDELENLYLMTRVDYIRYLQSRFPKKHAKVVARQTASRKKTIRKIYDIIFLRFCKDCSYDIPIGIEQCPKCGSYAIVEEKMKKAKVG